MNKKNGIGESKPKQSRRQGESAPEMPVGRAYAVESLAVGNVLRIRTGLATKSLDGIDKIRNHLVANLTLVCLGLNKRVRTNVNLFEEFVNSRWKGNRCNSLFTKYRSGVLYRTDVGKLKSIDRAGTTLSFVSSGIPFCSVAWFNFKNRRNHLEQRKNPAQRRKARSGKYFSGWARRMLVERFRRRPLTPD